MGTLGGYLEFQQMEIVNHRRKMLDVMEINAEGNDNLSTRVINTENIEKNEEEVSYQQTYFFSKLFTCANSLNVTFPGKLLYF